jgi:energy-coupling factor transport system permease protein
MLFQIVTPDTPVIGPLTGGVAVYLEGAVHGATQSLRLLALLTAGMTLATCTPPQMLLKGLRRLRLPYKGAFMVATALRFIPTIASETRATLAAMKARGYPMRPSRPWRYLAALTSAITPVMFRNMRRASMLADSVESRGFAMREDDGSPAKAGRGALGSLTLWLAPTITILLIAAKLLNIAAVSGLYFSDHIEWIYVLAETIL